LFFVVVRSSVRTIFLKTDERDIHRKMYPKYGLFDFFESKSIEVAATSNIVWGDTEPPRTLDDCIDQGTIIRVRWKTGKRSKSARKQDNEEFSAKLLIVHGKFSTMFIYTVCHLK